jgi:hypothetical protein
LKIVLALTALIFTYLVYGLYLAQYDVRILPEELKAEPPRGYFDYRGVTNVHTRLSSGTGDQAEVIAAAQAAGLDYLSITDLNVFDHPRVAPGYHGAMLVLIDGQYSYLNSRLLNLGAKSTHRLQSLGRAQVMLADALSQTARESEAGLLVLSHPLKGRSQWTGEFPPGLDGIEIINLKNVWQEAWRHDKASFLYNLFVFPFNETLGLLRLFRSPDEELGIWDELSRRRPTIGLAGADADSKMVVGGGFLRYPSYQTLFSLVRNHLLLKSELTGNAPNDAEKLTAALRAGNFYVSLDILGDPKGFNAVVRTREGQVHPMGSSLRFREGLNLEVTLPQKPKVPFDTVIYKNGERLMTSNSTFTQFYVTEPGVYRVMVRVIPTLPLPDGKKWIPWIFTNSFYLGSGTRTIKPAVGGN